MTCEERQRFWNDRLDSAGDAWSPGPSWDPHLATCEHCQAVDAGFETLGRAIGAWSASAPAPPAFATLRFAARASEESRKRPAWAFRIAIPLATAASALLIARSVSPQHPGPGPAAPAPILARSPASVPTSPVAARPSPEVARLAPERAGWVGDAPAGEPSPRGGSAAATVEARARSPLGDSARQAFGFLIGPALDAQAAGEAQGAL